MSEADKALSPYAMFSSNADKETAGIWKTIGVAKFLLARAGGANDRFMKAAKDKFLPFQAAINADTLPREVANKLAVEVFVGTVLLDWQDVRDLNGEMLPFSREAAMKLLTDLPELFTLLSQEANKLANFQGEQVDEAAKN